MNEYSIFDFSIKEKDIISTIKEAKESGYNAFVVINGQYYDIKIEYEKINE